MNNVEYNKAVLKTESVDFQSIKSRLNSNSIIRLLHTAMGLCTEAGETLDAMKKYIFYGKPVDRVNVAEELGDLLWYVNVALDELGIDVETVQKANVEKLKSRYGDKFNETKAVERDLKNENKTLDRALNKISVDADVVKKLLEIK